MTISNHLLQNTKQLKELEASTRTGAAAAGDVAHRDFGALSPFELKDELIKLAQSNSDKMMLNAGRGNPNFLALDPREAFFALGRFALRESRRTFAHMPEGVGGFPKREGLGDRFEAFAREEKEDSGAQLLKAAVSYVRDQLGIHSDDFLGELCEASLACSYPVPDRMLKVCEKICARYLRKEMVGNHPFAEKFDLYAVEGGTAAMTYLFNSLRENHILKAGDSIALALPIFTPYIEIPKLDDYGLVEVGINADPAKGWQFSDEEIDKLRDPKVKAFFLVNPSNPPSVKIDDRTLQRIGQIAKERPDLVILTDDVYGTFADNFTSLFAVAPRNTILVYSYSKHFGATGWRLGLVALCEDNVIDAAIAKLPQAQKDRLHERYESITTEPDKLKFIDRLVADSRTVALNHTAGLSTPQQAQMALFSLFALMDEKDAYKHAVKGLVRRRKAALRSAMGLTPEKDPGRNSVDYYHILDLEVTGGELYGKGFVEWFKKEVPASEALFRLAKESAVVMLPGRGFGALHPSARVSLANLTEPDYEKIGSAAKTLMDDYHRRYMQSPAGKAQAERDGAPDSAAIGEGRHSAAQQKAWKD